MSTEIAKKRGRPKRVVEEVVNTNPEKIPLKTTSKKAPKQASPASATKRKSNGLKDREIPKPIESTASGTELKAKTAAIALRPKKTVAEPESPPPPQVLATIAVQESKIIQQIAALKVEQELKRAAVIPQTSSPVVIEPTHSPELVVEAPPTIIQTIPSTQATTMPSSVPPSKFYQWLPNPPILAQQTAFRTLSTTTKLHSSPKPKPYTNKAKALNNLAVGASGAPTKGEKGGINPGGFPVTYKSATRRITAIIVAAPIALCMSWFLYERLVLGVEQKKLGQPPASNGGSEGPPPTATTTELSSGS